MRLAFVDCVHAYAADRPESSQALDATCAAVCFLARELVKAEVPCTLFNGIETPTTAHNIPALPLDVLPDAAQSQAVDAYIFCGQWNEHQVRLVRSHTNAPLIAWMQESSFNNENAPAVSLFDGVVFVSAWQARVNQPQMRSYWKQTIIRNAMNPCFTDLFAATESLRAAKTQPPVLLYAGDFTRGAFHLPPMLDMLRPLIGDFALEIYTDPAIATDVRAGAAYLNWLRSLPNISHIGKVGPTELAQRMKRATLFLAPCTWPETSCVALIEAMAAGMLCIATNRAALPETASGFARLVALEDISHATRYDMPLPYEAFASSVGDALKEWRLNPITTEARLRTQRQYFLARYQWSQRVAPWIHFLQAFNEDRIAVVLE